MNSKWEFISNLYKIISKKNAVYGTNYLGCGSYRAKNKTLISFIINQKILNNSKTNLCLHPNQEKKKKRRIPEKIPQIPLPELHPTQFPVSRHWRKSGVFLTYTREMEIDGQGIPPT